MLSPVCGEPNGNTLKSCGNWEEEPRPWPFIKPALHVKGAQLLVLKRVLINIYKTTGFIRLQGQAARFHLQKWRCLYEGKKVQENIKMGSIREQTKQNMNFKKRSICISNSNRSPLARRRLRIEIKHFLSVQAQGAICFPRSWYQGIWDLGQSSSNWWFLVG